MNQSKFPPLRPSQVSFFTLAVQIALLEHIGSMDTTDLREIIKTFNDEYDITVENSAKHGLLKDPLHALDELAAGTASMEDVMTLSMYLIGYVLDETHPEGEFGRVGSVEELGRITREPYKSLVVDKGNIYWHAWDSAYQFLGNDLGLSVMDIEKECEVETAWTWSTAYKAGKKTDTDMWGYSLWLTSQISNPAMSAITFLRLMHCAARLVIKNKEKLAAVLSK